MAGRKFKHIANSPLDSVYVNVTIYAEDEEIYLDIDKILSLKIIERMDYFFYTGTIEYYDIGGWCETAKLNGNEKVTVDIGTDPENFNSFTFRIWSVVHTQAVGDDEFPNRLVKFEMISEKALNNKFTDWSFGMKPIHERASQIISSGLNMVPDVHSCISVPLHSDGNYILPRITCQDALFDCMKLAINKKYNTCDYVTFQCHENKMNFWSIAELKKASEYKEEFYENAKDKQNIKMNEMYHQGTIKIEPGFCKYNANKVFTCGYDYSSGEYIHDESNFSNLTKNVKMEGNKGGFPILQNEEIESQKMKIDYFLQTPQWLKTVGRSDIFSSHKRLFLGDFITYANHERKVGDIIKLKLKGGSPDDRPFNKLFYGNVLIFGIIHFISQMQYYQRIMVFKDSYYYAKGNENNTGKLIGG